MPKIQNTLAVLERRNRPKMRVAVRNWLKSAEQQITKDLTQKYIKTVSRVVTELTDWELIEANGIETIKPAAVEIMRSGGNVAYRSLAIKGSFDIVNFDAVKAVNKFGTKLVTEVTKGTKEGINLFIKEGIKQGHSMSKIARNMRPLVGLTANQTQSIINYRKLLHERRPGLTEAQLDKATLRYTNKTHRMRLEMIARTETANAQNIGYCQGLGQVGVKQAELINGPNPCEECIALNHQRWPVEEAEGIIAVHPRCTCAMLPVIDDSNVSQSRRKPHPKLKKVGV
jgi:hypothetical protein